jgi:predicted DNA-binding protein (UPF0251 family)
VQRAGKNSLVLDHTFYKKATCARKVAVVVVMGKIMGIKAGTNVQSIGLTLFYFPIR